VFRDAGDGSPVAVANTIREAFAKTEFFTKAPPSKMDNRTRELLASRAKLALWIAWALGRDRTGWNVQSGMRLHGPSLSEVFAWADLRKELVLLGVPTGAIQWGGEATDLSTARRIEVPRRGGFRARSAMDLMARPNLRSPASGRLACHRPFRHPAPACKRRCATRSTTTRPG